MTSITDNEEDNYNKELYEALMRDKELYEALMREEKEQVIELCEKNPEGPLHMVTIQNDTVLHVATYSKQNDLVKRLLELLPESHYNKMTVPNNIGNTILHEAATSNKIVPAAREMLRKAPELLGLRSRHGETALFRAARYGKKVMFKFLDGEMNRILSDATEEAQIVFHQRDDKTTILHATILAENFELALWIANKYEYLVGAQDGDGMTALQLLACNPSAFLSGTKLGSIERLIYSWVAVAFYTTVTKEGVAVANDTTVTKEESCYRMPFCEAIRKKKQKNKSALELAKFLIKRDTSWKATESVMDPNKLKIHRYGQEVGKEVLKASTSGNTPEIALFLAAKAGITEIVEEILKQYPQAVEHMDNHGRTILHVAIKYRQMQIFDLVEKMEIPTRRLIRKTDNSGNTILHMVGEMVADHEAKEKPNPALLLQEDLLFFKRVKKICTTQYVNCWNFNGQTAKVLFATNSDNLRANAKEWVKGTAESCSIVAVFIATVAFNAPYTLPGGTNQNTGLPILLNQPCFLIFVIADVLSFVFALTSVITFLTVLASPYRLKDFQYSLFQKLRRGVILLISCVLAMMVAFAATIILTIHHKKEWTTIVLCSVVFFPATVFVLSFLRHRTLMNNIKCSLKLAEKGVPRFSSSSTPSGLTNSLKCHKSKPVNLAVSTQSHVNQV